MAWEVDLLARTRLGVYGNCLKLIDAYAGLAPQWERFLLATYITVGPPLARLFGGNTKTLWMQADSVIRDVLEVSGLAPDQIAKGLRQYVKIKLKGRDHLPFADAREIIYDQAFYPLVTHFTFALQPSAVARMRFVRRTVNSISGTGLTVADLGCGAGAMLCEVLKGKPSWTGCGLDISEAAAAYAKRLAKHKGVADRVEFHIGCVSNLPYDSGSFDVVIASEVVEHMPDPQRVLRELARVLGAGGLLILTVPVESRTPAHASTLGGPREFRLLCEKAGLRVRSIESKWHLAYGDDNKHIFVVAEGTDEMQSLYWKL